MSFAQRGSINRHLLALSLLQKKFSALLRLNHESKVIISYPVTGRQGERNDISLLDQFVHQALFPFLQLNHTLHLSNLSYMNTTPY